ncbi:MAG: glycosyltransferase family A protein [Planctomycetota bacterium]
MRVSQTSKVNESIGVVVFAYNEEARIERCLESVLREAERLNEVRIHVIANGCTDRTEAVVQKVARRDPRVSLTVLDVKDKCNAWNHYVHELADARPVHFFMDGDVTCGEGSLAAMTQELLAHPSAHAMAGLPLSGRNRSHYETLVRTKGWLFGNLYAVRREHLVRLRELAIRLPRGLCGNDHFITRIMSSDLDPTWREDRLRILWKQGAGYEFRSLQPYRAADIRTYWRRSVTYRLRALQLAKTYNLSLCQLPESMDEINREILTELERDAPSILDWRSRAVRNRLRASLGLEAKSGSEREAKDSCSGRQLIAALNLGALI